MGGVHVSPASSKVPIYPRRETEALTADQSVSPDDGSTVRRRRRLISSRHVIPRRASTRHVSQSVSHVLVDKGPKRPLGTPPASCSLKNRGRQTGCLKSTVFVHTWVRAASMSLLPSLYSSSGVQQQWKLRRGRTATPAQWQRRLRRANTTILAPYASDYYCARSSSRAATASAAAAGSVCCRAATYAPPPASPAASPAR